MSINFDWNEDYSIGIQEIDCQHKRFLAFISEIFMLRQTKPGSSEIQELLKELERYLIFHTKSEECMMQMYFYPKYEEQYREHTQIIKTVKEKIKTLPQTHEDVMDLLLFLMNWFRNHTTSFDKDFGEYLKRQKGF